jgi:glucose/arabinose dehydrogenase
MTFNGTALSGCTAIVTGTRKNRHHNGGRIRIGPDGFLYATTGDAQHGDDAQDRNSLNGKILRAIKTPQPAGPRVGLRRAAVVIGARQVRGRRAEPDPARPQLRLAHLRGDV